MLVVNVLVCGGFALRNDALDLLVRLEFVRLALAFEVDRLEVLSTE